MISNLVDAGGCEISPPLSHTPKGFSFFLFLISSFKLVTARSLQRYIFFQSWRALPVVAYLLTYCIPFYVTYLCLLLLLYEEGLKMRISCGGEKDAGAYPSCAGRLTVFSFSYLMFKSADHELLLFFFLLTPGKEKERKTE